MDVCTLSSLTPSFPISLFDTCSRTLSLKEAQQGAQTVDWGSQQQLVLLRRKRHIEVKHEICRRKKKKKKKYLSALKCQIAASQGKSRMWNVCLCALARQKWARWQQQMNWGKKHRYLLSNRRRCSQQKKGGKKGTLERVTEWCFNNACLSRSVRAYTEHYVVSKNTEVGHGDI